MEADTSRLRLQSTWVIAVTPVVLTGVMVILLTTDATRGMAMRLSRENSIIELVTAGLLLLGGLWGIRLAFRAKREGAQRYEWGFFLLFSFAMLLVGMEELAWGQKLFGFEVPEAVAKLNQQEDFTLHNMPGLHGRSEVFWSVFAVGGLVGIWLLRQKSFEKIAPAKVLAPWFLMILCIAMLAVWKAPGHTDNRLLLLAGRMDEFNEMLIAMASCLYLWLCGRRLAQADVQAAGY